MTSAGPFRDLERLAETGFRGGNVEHQPVREPGVAQAVNQVETVALTLGVRRGPRLDPVHFVEVVVICRGEGRDGGGHADGEGALTVSSRQARRDVLVDTGTP